MSDQGLIDPESPHFSGFVFKIQANMNRRHRDRVAFLRVCSGVFEKDMVITNARQGAEIRASRPYRFFGGNRETIEKAYPGDVVGLVNPGQFGIGDTLYHGIALKYPAIPRFPAEHFGIARLRDVRFKQFDDGIRQLEEEGLMQVLYPTVGRREPILGTVGPLQLEVLKARLENEYNVQCDVDSLPYKAARWVVGPADKIAAMSASTAGTRSATDRDGRPMILFESEWALEYCERNNPGRAVAGGHAVRDVEVRPVGSVRARAGIRIGPVGSPYRAIDFRSLQSRDHQISRSVLSTSRPCRRRASRRRPELPSSLPECRRSALPW